MSMADDIDPVKFGLLIGQVKALESQVESLQADVKQLLELANKGKGGLWFGMGIASLLGGLFGWVVDHVRMN